ncbi:DJ-1/PfpI family protein [Pseudomonas cichorii]|uniref:GlxA family transcriptional regulator n=1 Tax=Pseudomonas cichorii TaxID=36746 RepID=UPI001C873C86|nr:helix-turn-helix domain-containing protein [Pseudomonas cichorii]MBX8486855.1 DJ-1/PfpI family protein [Pseudomonas cichorii]MBX8490879.1 DJ-1/PfpI family protein [Pseudomonas cichorii]MBX8509021.1 DJ-1/PfpI family protein [Pseudomonas cichorii]MBX8515623.1 DJ-1/PfpI family protein [Pseudomonas cichorii]MBX8518327.1 DJ-1/PfpI family protein [Pseudomonas cichorii]
MLTKSVQFFTYPGVSLLDLAGPLDVFIAANHLAKSTHRPYAPSIIALNITTEVFSSFSLSTELLNADTAPADTLIVPGGPGIHELCEEPRFFSHFVNHTHKARRLVSVCTGVFALAAAGKLDGRKATTHWSAYDELEHRFPSITVKRGPIFINDDNVWTSAGVTAGIDLALAIVEEDLGHGAALEVARHLIMFIKRPGDQDQFSSSLTLQSKSSQFSDLHAWMNENLKTDLSLPLLANFMNMSERTFIRKYKDSTGQTPSKMVEVLRLEAARQLLVTSNNPLKVVAHHCGLGTESTFIRRFVKAFGVTPKEYRVRFKSQQ